MNASSMQPAAEVARAFERTRQRIRDAGGTDVELVAVTKGFGPDAIALAAENGATAVGENYAQELVGKLDALSRTTGLHVPSVYFIGRLQTNKVKHLARRVARYETVDRASLIAEIARRDPGASVLIQVAPDGTEPNNTSVPAKGGCRLSEVDALVEAADAAGLAVLGLMTVGPTTGGPDAAAPGFAAVRRAVDRLGLSVCSMGMSADLEVAVREGSTEVRIGSALFGKRRYPNR